jgi:hypothetical protein
MLGLFRKKSVITSVTQRLNHPGASEIRPVVSNRLVTGHGEWNAGLEDVLYDRLDQLGVPLVYHKDGANTPSKETSDQYGHNSVLGKNAVDEGILLRKMGCKHLYPRFLAIFARSSIFTITRPGSREPYLSRRVDDLVDYVATFSNVHRATEGMRQEAKEFTDVVELTGEALLRRYPNHGILLNPGSPGATFAVPPEVVKALGHVLGF